MQTEQLYIPDRIKVGFRNRKDTYTGKLAYVIYFDNKGTLRKQSSWNSWRDHEIEPIEFANEPTEGFVLNKGVGGVRASYGWNARNEYIRVFDPRNFEFEISVANLLFILRECDCSRGKGLEGQFVYSWSGTELVLLPVNAEDYKRSKQYTSLQSQKIKAKELIPGASYITRKQDVLVYLGKFDYYTIGGYSYNTERSSVSKKFIFSRVGEKTEFVPLSDIKSIAAIQSDSVVQNYAELVEQYAKSINGSKVVGFILRESENKDTDKRGYYQPWSYEDKPGEYINCESHFHEGKTEYIRYASRYKIVDGFVVKEYLNNYAYQPDTNPMNRRGWYRETAKWREPTNQQLFMVLESGSEFRAY